MQKYLNYLFVIFKKPLKSQCGKLPNFEHAIPEMKLVKIDFVIFNYEQKNK